MTKAFAAAILGAFLMFTPIYGNDDHKGDKGEKGDKGDRGDKGQKGDRGEKGDLGEKGNKGDKGDRGPKGDQGPVGQQGPAGPAGPRGNEGRPGKDGTAGPVGAQGPKGDTGSPGQPGAPGPQGRPGTARNFTSAPDFKDCAVIGEPFEISTDADGSTRLSFPGSKTTALHGYRCPLRAVGTVEIAVTADHALTASGLIFGVFGVEGHASGMVENFIAGKHWGGFLTLKPDGTVNNTSVAFYPETATVWFRIVSEPGKVTFLYSATGKHWDKVSESITLAAAPYFVIAGEDLEGAQPYSFAVRHLRRF